VSVLAAGVAAYTVLATLLVACAAHLSRPSALARALAAHRVLPAPALTAAEVTAAEGLLGGAGCVALVTSGRETLLAAALAGAAVLLALFAGYGWYVLATGRTGPCGCSRAELPMTGWVVARAFALAALALLGFLLAGSVPPLHRLDAELTVVLLAAATFSCLLWQLPAAMAQPPPAEPPLPGTPPAPVRGDLPR
jgi:hypothetical protein